MSRDNSDHAFINGKLVRIERDPEMDQKVKKYEGESKIVRLTGFPLNSGNASTLGAGKKTGLYRKGQAIIEGKQIAAVIAAEKKQK